MGPDPVQTGGGNALEFDPGPFHQIGFESVVGTDPEDFNIFILLCLKNCQGGIHATPSPPRAY